MGQKPKSNKLGCLLHILIPAVGAVAIGLGLENAGADPETEMAMQLSAVFAFLFFLVISFGIYAARRNKRNKKFAQETRAAALAKVNAAEMDTMPHVTGLPIPDGAVCTVYVCPDRYIFDRDGSQFNLTFEKVTDVVCKTETEIQNNYVSSIGGAVAGAALFGALGAIVGGRAKKKTDKIIHKYLIFAYVKDEKTDFITFDCTDSLKTEVFVSAFKSYQQVQPGKQVDL